MGESWAKTDFEDRSQLVQLPDTDTVQVLGKNRRTNTNRGGEQQVLLASIICFLGHPSLCNCKYEY